MKARVPTALFFPFEIERERQALHQLALWGYRFSPIVAIDSARKKEDLVFDSRFTGLNFDITGCQRLFGGEQVLGERIRAELAGFGIQSRVGIAPTLGAAWALSRYARDPFVVLPSEIRSTTLPLRSNPLADSL
ncbi:MAG: hypothetical protein IT290_09945, partial [Deltaproteobacteria bacterium]|nr:hypothetical protein [Deltaproteobacteria bacterium]